MKVLITSPSLDEQENVSGISTMISGIIENAGCEFTHFAAGRKDSDAIDLNWVMTQLKLPFEFRHKISSTKPQIVHLNTAFEPRSIIRDFVLAKSAGKTPVVLHVHGGRFVMQDFKNPTLKWLAEQLLRSATRVITLSAAEAERLKQLAPGTSVAVLPNAIASARFNRHEGEREMKKILYLGRLDNSKGLSDMIEASRMLKDQGFRFGFVCYGAGPEKENFQRAMKRVIGDDFYYGGVVGGKEKDLVLTTADILLMPSRFEGLPLSLLEAMAAGCVPIVSDRGAIPTVVVDGRNGFLVEPGDLTQIVGKVKFLLSEGETGWYELRRNAQQTIRERFDIGTYVDKLKSIYREAVGSR